MIALSPGTVVGGEYVLDRAIGEGGMGAVYLARQRSTNRLRALKVLNAAVVADERSRERFAREAMAASLIESEHVVEVIAAGIDEALGGVPWLAMEFLEGEELTDHVARQPDGRLPHSHVRVVLEQVFHGIAAAHGAGVVHRDIKPQNVFLARSRLVGVPFVVKVLDFGIAKIVSETAPQSQTTSLGTPGWMAPEQVERGLATPAADVWALGLLSFFVITGTRFWPRGDQENVSIQTLLYEMMLAPIPSATERAGEHGRAHLLPPGFDAWLACCLVRDPASRIPNAGAAWDSLRKVLEDWDTASTVSTAPPTVALPPTTQRMWDKGQTQVAASATGPQLNSGSLPTGQGGWSPRTIPSGGPPAMQAPRRSNSKLLLIGSGLFLAGVITALAVALLVRKDDAPTTQLSTFPSQAITSTTTPPRPEVPTVRLSAAAFVLDEENVRVGDVVMDRIEVTVEQWQRCVDTGACDENVRTVTIVGAESWSVLCNWPRRAERPNHPINCVSRVQAEGYCRSVGKRLPTEEEWFRAAYVSNGRVRKFPWGNEAPRPGAVNFCGHDCAALLLAKQLVDSKEPMVQSSDGYPDTAPAGVLDGDQTPDGLLDMGGNVMEWTATAKGDNQARCLGGHWLVDRLEDASSGKVYAFDPTDRLVNLGFRCVRTAEKGVVDR